MFKIYMTDNNVIYEETKAEPGCWVHMVHPTVQECEQVCGLLGVEIDTADLMAALDEEESARIELEEGYTLILVDIPTLELRHEKEVYTTIPLGILLTQQHIITVCGKETSILQFFQEGRTKEFSTKKKMRFVYQILFRIAALYQNNLRIIDKKRIAIEGKVEGDTEDFDLIELHELESTLVYFATSLRANGVVLDRLTRYKRLEQYPDDQELLDDVIIENKQAIEMTSIYREIIKGTRELLSSIIDKRMNNAMKYLATITIIMAIPTIISGFYGMNVKNNSIPFASHPFGFGIVAAITVVVVLLVLIVLRRKKML